MLQSFEKALPEVVILEPNHQRSSGQELDFSWLVSCFGLQTNY
jgi:hypothetical protein